MFPIPSLLMLWVLDAATRRLYPAYTHVCEAIVVCGPSFGINGVFMDVTYFPVGLEESGGMIADFVNKSGRVSLARLAGPMQGPREFKPIIVQTEMGAALVVFSTETMMQNPVACKQWAAQNSMAQRVEYIETLSVSYVGSLMMWIYVSQRKHPSIRWLITEPTKPTTVSISSGSTAPFLSLFALPDADSIREFIADYVDVEQLDRDIGMSARPVNDNACFPLTTKILTPCGPRDLASLRVGDLVLSQAVSGRINVQKVTRKLDKGDAIISVVTLQDGRKLRTTGHHTVLSNRGWVRVDTLEVGDILSCVDSSGRPYHSNVVALQTEAVEPVFNLYTTGDHNVIADGVVAHNFTAFRVLRTSWHRLFVDPWFGERIEWNHRGRSRLELKHPS